MFGSFILITNHEVKYITRKIEEIRGYLSRKYESLGAYST